MAASGYAAPPDLLKAQGFARSMRVHRRQCILLCTCIEKTLSTGSPIESEPESGQQWDEALSNINERFAEWSKLNIVQSFLKSDQILMGIDQVRSELRWCGMRFEDSQLAEKRRQDEEILQGMLRIIASDRELLSEVLSHPSESIILFIKKLQNELLNDREPTDMRAKLEYALMFLYKKATVQLSTPNLTSQVSGVERIPTPSSPLLKTYHADWLDEERVAIKALRLVRYNPTHVKRFRREVAAHYAASKHSNIVRVYGMVLDEGLGCCIVTPMSPTNISALSFLNRVGDTNIVPWLLDIASAIQHLHAWVPPVICGCLRAANIWIKDDGVGVCISDFGLFQLSSQISDAVNNLLRWCAPEVIRAVKNEVSRNSAVSVCTRQTDVYSFGITMFEFCLHQLFTSNLPFHHIQEDETLDPEILHGTRPILSAELKARANRRGFSASMNALMKACWDQEPVQRPSMEVVAGKIMWHVNKERLETSGYRPGSSSGSIMSRASHSTASSGRDSSLHPMTPRSTGSLLASGSVSIASRSSAPGVSAGVSGHGLFSSSQLFTEPTQIELEPWKMERQASVELLRDMSKISLHSRPSLSENTIRQEPRSSFSSDHSEGSSHLGQRENSAYERMPKLKTLSLMASKEANKNRFEILTSRMTTDGRVNPNWAGVSSMEGLRGITRRSGKLTQVSAVESLIKRENQFLSDETDEHLAHCLRANPGILGIGRLEPFLTDMLEDSRTLRMVNRYFKNALQANSDVMATGFFQFSLLCKEAAMQFRLIYPSYIHRLPEVQKKIADELDSNDRFSEIMNETQPNGSTLRQSLDKFLCAPVTHLQQHPRTLQLIISEMSTDDPEMPLLQEALAEMLKTVNLVHVSEWQRSNSEADMSWKDFVSKESVKGASGVDINRQTTIFELISEERTYVEKLKMLQKVLQNIYWELANLRRSEDVVLQDITKALISVVTDFLRFHSRLLENLFTLQRSQHPLIGTIVTTCGIDQIPWHSLYDHRFGNTYRRLVSMIQDGRARLGIFKRVMQQEQSCSEFDFMQFLRTPSIHLRFFVNGLKKIAELADNLNEDRQVVSEILPRLFDVCQQVELKTSASKERARLASLAAALDFRNFPGVENDVDIASGSRTLIMSGNLKLRVASPQTKRVFLEERFTLLLDNYLIFTRKSDSQGTLHLEVCERPLALDLLVISNDGIPPTSVEDALFPCMRIQSSEHDPLYLYGETEYTSRIWRSKLEESRSARAELTEKIRVIDLEVLHRFAKIPSCSAEFRHAGEDMVAIACEQPTPGIWLRQGRDPNFRLAVSLNDILQLTVLDEHGIFLVLAEKLLLWYRQDEIMKGTRVVQRSVDETMTVNFYRTGILANRCFLIVSASRNGRNVLRFFEVSGSGKSSKVMNAFKNKPSPFSLLAEIELHSHVKDVHFLKSSFVLVGDAFQLLNFINIQQFKESLSSTKPQLLPLPSDPLTDLAERCHSSGPVAIHRIDNDFILCYQGFAAYINANGQLSPKVVEWESGSAQNIIFRPPYMLILGVSTLEVRQVANGKLMQLLAVPGSVKLAWERRCDEDSKSKCDLGIHLIMGSGLDGPPPSHWYSLDNSLPYTLFRLSSH